MKTYVKDCRWGKFLLLHGDFISHFMNMFGEWSEAEVDLFRWLLPADGVVIEVGSNIGTHAVPLSMICPQGRVYCYEPQRQIYHILCANLALNNRLNVFALHSGVGDTVGRIAIESSDYDEPFNYGSYSLTQGFSTETAFKGHLSSEIVPITSLDGDPNLGDLQNVHLLKIDAEGFEPQVIAGAEQIILKFRPDIFVEANKPEVLEAAMKALLPLGYIGYWFVSHRFRPDNYNRSPFVVAGWDANIIFRQTNRPVPSGLRVAQDFDDLSRGVAILNKFEG
ncbi:FkbM family methyltransferase [Sandarakinorhabdus sp.]|uniref:FkbM family methyltransferase n=1 Tax=Sandarakinorhabdus sp. TaxID=1916663 RepID=UPI003342C2FE